VLPAGTSFFYENFLPGTFGLEPKRKAAGGPLVLSLPMARAKPLLRSQHGPKPADTPATVWQPGFGSTC
jgi:hypothetical protein